MNKTKFKQYMKELISLKRDEENLNKALKKFSPDFNYISFSRYETLVIDILRKSTGDKYNNISYWLYDLNEGKDAVKDSVTDKEGKGIPIKTLDDLYNMIEYDKKNN